jgi:lipoate-protein ligase B
MGMSDTAKIRAELELIGQEGIDQLKARLTELNAIGPQVAAALGRGEISAAEFDAEAKRLSVSVKNLEQAIRALEAAQEAQIDRLGEQVALELELAAAADKLASAKASESAQAGLAHQLELEAMAIEHETAMLEHEEQQLRATKAAEDALVAAVGQSIQADLAASNATEALTSDRAAGKITLAQEIDFERLDAQVKRQEAQAARELADAEQDAAAAAQHESTILVGQAQSLDHVSNEMGQLVAAFGRGEISVHEYDFAVRQLDGSNAKLVHTSTTAEAAIRNGTRSTANYGLAALEASRGIEDMQYGLGGVINNIPTFTMLMGGTGGVAAAISLVSVGSYVLLKHWDDLTGLYQTRNPFPEVTGNLNELEGALKKNNKELDELREKSSLSNDQLARANLLIAEQTRLEAEQEAARDVKKIKDTKSEQQRKQADEFKAIVDKIGGTQALADVQQAVSEKYPGRGAQADKDLSERLLRNALAGNAAARDETEQLFLGGYGKGTRFGTQMMGGPNVGALAGEGIHFTEGERKAMDKVRKDREEGEKKDNEKRKQVQTDALDNLVKSKELDETNETIARQITAQGLSQEQTFELTKNQIQENILLWLEQREIATEGAAQIAGKEAANLAAQAIGRVDRGGKAADKAEDKEADKRRDAQIKAANEKVAQGFKASEAKDKATAGVILGQVPKGAPEIFRAMVEQSMLPAEEAVKQLVDTLTLQFRHAGAAAGGANLAARQIAGRAGFVVEAPRPFVGPPVPAAVRRANAAEARKTARRSRPVRRKAQADVGGPGMRSIAPTPDVGVQELGEAQGNNQQKLMQVAAQQNGAIGALINRQQAQAQGIDGLLRDASQLRGLATNTGTNLNFGHP